METNPPLITELRSLLVAVSDHGKQHLVEVESDLQQTTLLLSEAIEKLSVGFMAVHTAAAKQQQLLNTILSAHQFDPAEASQLDALSNEIGNEVNAVVTGLQFQDLTSQLLNRTLKRVNGLKDLLDELAHHSDEGEHEHEQIAQFLDKKNHSLHVSSRALSGGLRRAVAQQDLMTGEVELF